MSDDSHWTRVREILGNALDLPPEVREDFVHSECGGDPRLLAEVRSLLEADADQPEAFLTVPAPVLAGALDPKGPSPGVEADRTWLGEKVGAYTIQRILGEGGMGVVFEALQESPRRLVALKLVRRGHACDDGAVRLFQREVEALARLHHPSIAAIYESGSTDDGRHFFAMEKVGGVPLDEYLAGQSSPRSKGERRRRLSLFLGIAEAMAYAHRRGVIHRDLKPSNIHVTEDGPRILDFGLARIVDGDVALQTVGLQTGALYGTLPYMSPEQLRGNVAEIDVRSDVYALGVLLYEMTTGALPIDVRGDSLPSALRKIEEVAPTAPRSIDASLEKDLVTILLKSLEKSPASRYQTVDAMADDVRRFIDDLPILARPAGVGEQLMRFARRHRVSFVLGVAAAALVVAGAIGTTVGMLRALRAEQSAREEAKTARAVSDFLEEIFVVNDPSAPGASAVTARDLLEVAASRIDTSFVGEPTVRGRLLGVLGTVYRNLGLYREAGPLLEQSLAVRVDNPDEDPLELARSHHSLASLLRRLHEFDRARVHYEAALDIREANVDPPNAELAATYLALANLAYDEGRPEEGLPLAESAVEMARSALGEGHYDFPSFLSSLGFMLDGVGRKEDALAVLTETVALRESVLGPDHPNVGFDLYVEASVLEDLGRYDEAVVLARRAVQITEAGLGPDHVSLADSMLGLSSLELRIGDATSAEGHSRRALAILEAALGPDHVSLGEAYDLLAESLLALGRNWRHVRSSSAPNNSFP
ncbi:MAG: serine/threonine-protein kinase [Candidatus Eisenbacteria bacterium]